MLLKIISSVRDSKYFTDLDLKTLTDYFSFKLNILIGLTSWLYCCVFQPANGVQNWSKLIFNIFLPHTR